MLNRISRNQTRDSSYPQYFIENMKTINNMDAVDGDFNKHFASVGPNLAEKIIDPETPKEGTDDDDI